GKGLPRPAGPPFAWRSPSRQSPAWWCRPSPRPSPSRSPPGSSPGAEQPARRTIHVFGSSDACASTRLNLQGGFTRAASPWLLLTTVLLSSLIRAGTDRRGTPGPSSGPGTGDAIAAGPGSGLSEPHRGQSPG